MPESQDPPLKQYLVSFTIKMEVIVNGEDEDAVLEDFADGDEEMLTQILEGCIPAPTKLSELDQNEIGIVEASESDLIRVLGEADPLIEGAVEEEEEPEDGVDGEDTEPDAGSPVEDIEAEEVDK